MATNEDVLITFKALDQVSNVAKSIGSSVSQLGLVGYQAITTLSAQVSGFSSECVEKAKDAETGWIAFNNSLSKSGITSTESLGTVKSEVTSLANQMGVSVGDARTSFTSLNNKIGDSTQSLNGLQAAQALASATGQNLSSTTSILTGALNGRGAALKKLGIDIDNYKNNETGAIDTEKLFQDIINQNKQALTQYGNSATAVNQRLENSFASFETKIGQSMNNAKSAIAPFISDLMKGLGQVDDATGGAISTLAGLGLTAMGTMGDLANVTITLTNMISLYRDMKGAMEGCTIASELYNAVKTKLFATEVMTDNKLASEIGLREGLLTATEAETLAESENTVVQEAGLVTRAMSTASIIAESVANEGLFATLGMVMAGEYGVLAPILLIIGAIALLVGALYLVGQYFGWWTDFPSFINAVKNAIMKLPQMFVNFLNKLKEIPTVVAQFLGKIPSIILGVISRAISAMSTLAKNMLDGFKNAFIQLGTIIADELRKIPQMILDHVGDIANAIGNLAGQMLDKFKQMLGFGSPSLIYKSIKWDLEDMPSMIDKNSGGIVNSISNLGTRMSQGYNSGLKSSQIGAISGYTSTSAGFGQTGTTQNTNNHKIINIHEGAIKLDARNLTTKESKQIMINALEGLQDYNGGSTI